MRNLAKFLACVVLPAAAQAQTFQPGRLPAASRDSFEVLAQGAPAGSLVVSLARSGDTLRMVADLRMAIGPASLVNIDSVVSSAATLVPTSITTVQEGRGMRMVSHVAVAGGRAKGTAQTPSAGGPQSMSIDAELPARAMANSMEYLLLPTLDLRDGFTMPCLAFDVTTGATEDCSVTVAGKETVTVPAGSFEAWKVIYKTHHSIAMYISTAEPKKLLLIRPDGIPVEMRRVSK